jgi:dTDP-4-amino-4,6-dideoxygalactose transaminase
VSFRIFLSPPHLDGDERDLLLDALDSNWIAPLGPHVDAFEAEIAEVAGRRHAVALSSGTAALHLALIAEGVGAGDDVLVPTLTFAATANAVTYVGARPVFIDADPSSWNLDPDLVAEELERRRRTGAGMPAAIITVDLYGQCADYDRLLPLASEYGIPLIEDAAEALGASLAGRPAGSFGRSGVFSFNGNKIITSSGGGMLVTDDAEVARTVRYLATQAREPVAHYEHREVGFNYRLSNLLAAVGRGQLARLDAKVTRRRAINAAYRETLGDLPGVGFMPCASGSEPTWWLTCLQIDEDEAGGSPEDVITALGAQDIEARPVWKPMHLQPVFADAPVVGGQVAAGIFERGVCLPSGSSMTEAQHVEVSELVRKALSSTSS